jgi:hypothetical protein
LLARKIAVQFGDTARMALTNGHDFTLQGAAILHLVRYQCMALISITAESLIGFRFILFDGRRALASHPIPYPPRGTAPELRPCRVGDH